VVKPNRLRASNYKEWVQVATKTTRNLEETKHHLTKVKSDFHTSLPHNFIETDLIILIESSLQNLTDQIEKQQQFATEFKQRLLLLSSYYGD
jgi:MoxR-like ATPase